MPSHNMPTGPDAGAGVSADEAFSRALSAMYWSGYWAATYHVSPISMPSRESYSDRRTIVQAARRAESAQVGQTVNGVEEAEDMDESDAASETDELVPTQR